MRPVVIQHDLVRRPVEVVELSGPHGPHECRTNQEREHDGQRDEQEQDVHVSGAGPPQATDCAPSGAASEASVGVVSFQPLARRMAFATTTSEDTAIPIDAANGDTRPAAASGIATTL